MPQPTDPFVAAFERTVGIEGKYSNDPNDSGGETMWGITARVARAHGYAGDMRTMPIGVAQCIYRDGYWKLMRLDDVASVSTAIASELFDTAVNCGVGVAGSYLQRALNAFNHNGADYPDVTVDNVVGPLTVDCLRRFFKARGFEAQPVLLAALNSLQGAGYIEIAEQHPKDEAFTFGWFKNRVLSS